MELAKESQKAVNELAAPWMRKTETVAMLTMIVIYSGIILTIAWTLDKPTLLIMHII